MYGPPSTIGLIRKDYLDYVEDGAIFEIDGEIRTVLQGGHGTEHPINPCQESPTFRGHQFHPECQSRGIGEGHEVVI